MSWRQEAMKDVGTCDKPRGGGNRPVILGSPNGATHPQGYFTLNALGLSANGGNLNISVPPVKESNSDSVSRGDRKRIKRYGERTGWNAGPEKVKAL
jgi:hypothetical protein